MANRGLASLSEPCLAGQVALVTGAAHRLGAAIALGLAARGVHLVLHYWRSEEAAEALAASLIRAGGTARTLGADLSRPAEALTLLERAGPVDLLINSASVFWADEFRDAPAPGDGTDPSALKGYLSRLAGLLQVNTLAPALLARAMAEMGRPAQVINLLDARVAGYDPAHFSYGLSKQLLAELTRQLALDLAPHIRVNGVAPGPILPPPGAGPEALEVRGRAVPLGRPGRAEDVVRAVIFLAESDYVTGQVIYVDGGAHLAPSRAWSAPHTLQAPSVPDAAALAAEQSDSRGARRSS